MNCPDCKGTGRVPLLTKNVECECRRRAVAGPAVVAMRYDFTAGAGLFVQMIASMDTAAVGPAISGDLNVSSDRLDARGLMEAAAAALEAAAAQVRRDMGQPPPR